VGHRFPILRNEKDDQRLTSRITEATLHSWKNVCEPHIKGIKQNPQMFWIWWVERRIHFEEKVSNFINISLNSGIFLYKVVKIKFFSCLSWILNSLNTLPEFRLIFIKFETFSSKWILRSTHQIQNICGFCLESRMPFIRLLIFWIPKDGKTMSHTKY
jgi:hypothetical protein